MAIPSDSSDERMSPLPARDLIKTPGRFHDTLISIRLALGCRATPQRPVRFVSLILHAFRALWLAAVDVYPELVFFAAQSIPRYFLILELGWNLFLNLLCAPFFQKEVRSSLVVYFPFPVECFANIT